MAGTRREEEGLRTGFAYHRPSRNSAVCGMDAAKHKRNMLGKHQTTRSGELLLGRQAGRLNAPAGPMKFLLGERSSACCVNATATNQGRVRRGRTRRKHARLNTLAHLRKNHALEAVFVLFSSGRQSRLRSLPHTIVEESARACRHNVPSKRRFYLVRVLGVLVLLLRRDGQRGHKRCDARTAALSQRAWQAQQWQRSEDEIGRQWGK